MRGAKNRSGWIGVLALVLATVVVGAASQPLGANQAGADGARQFVYVSLGGEGEIAVFGMDGESGELTPLGSVSSGQNTGPLAVNADGSLLYASIRGTKNISTWSIDAKSGKLKRIGTVETVGGATYLAIDDTGRYLMSAYYREAKAAVHRIHQDGLVGKEPAALVSTDKNPHSILPDRSNRFVYVPNTGADKILIYRLDGSSGKLVAASPAFAATSSGDGPRHLYFHPSGPWLFVVNEKSSSVTAYRHDAGSGQLAALQTISTLPDGFSERNTCADIEVHPSGKFVYASNRGHNSIAGFRIDAESGRLASLGQQPTEDTPRSFNIEPGGKFLYAAGQASGKLAAYRIDGESGKLAPLAVYPVGKGPSWVMAVRPKN